MRSRSAIVVLADDGFVYGEAGCRLEGFAEEEEERRQVDKWDCVFCHLGWPRDPEMLIDGVDDIEKSD